MGTQSKWLFLIIAFSFSINLYSQQSVYYDAKYIYENCFSTVDGAFKDRDNLFKALESYYSKTKLSEDELKNNSFFKSYVPDAGIQSIKGKSNYTNEILSSVGGLDVTSLADGFAKFIVKRTKQELNIAFFEKFKETITDPNYKDLQSIFPQTYRTLSAIGEDIYMYEAYIMALRESFEKDLASLPSNLPEIIDNHPEYFKQAPELEAELRTAFYMAQAIQNKQHPGEIVAYFDERILNSEPNAKAAFQTLKLFSASLQSKNDSVYWVSEKEIKALLSGQTLFNIYMGLVLQKAKNENIVFKNKDNKNIRLDSVLNKAHDDMQHFKIYLTTLASKTQQLETRIKGLKKIKSDSLLFENYYSILSSSIDLMKYTINEIPIPNKNELTFNSQTKSLKEITDVYFDFAQTGADIAIDVNRRNYSSAIVNAAYLYEKTIKAYDYSRKHKIEKLQKAKSESEWVYLRNKQYVTYLYTLQKIKDSLVITNKDSLIIKADEYKRNKNLKLDIDVATGMQIANNIINNDNIISSKLINDTTESGNSYRKAQNVLLEFKNEKIKDSISTKVTQSIVKYGSFMAAITQAKSSDEVEAAIEAIALPTGSARIKRESKFNVSINAYCGLFTGYEKIKGIASDFGFNSYGVSAPIGFSISQGKQHILPFTSMKRYNGHWSHSIFLSAIDIGAITAFRFANDSTESAPTIELKDIISPGVFYSVGIPKCPLSVNFGYQVGPLLRKVTATANSYSENYTRFSVSLCVDIPILNLYTSSRKN